MQPPTPADEAVRDLAGRATTRARTCSGAVSRQVALAAWAALRGEELDPSPSSVGRQFDVDPRGRARVVDDYQLAIDHTEARLLELDARLAELAEQAPSREPVGWLRCFRGIDTLTAMLILAELHDFRRFGSARALMALLGLVPGEDSSGETHRRGRITKMGNALVRRILVKKPQQVELYVLVDNREAA